MTLLAIDPGKNGGLIWGTGINPGSYESSSMPSSYEKLSLLFRELKAIKIEKVYLEFISGFMAGMKTRNPETGNEEGGVSPKAMFTFGTNYGALEYACVREGFKTFLVSPQKWQRSVGMSGIKKQLVSQSQWKNTLKEKAQKLFPHEKVTLKTADALLIYYAAHKNKI